MGVFHCPGKQTGSNKRKNGKDMGSVTIYSKKNVDALT